jgi:hypothetical protein
MSKVRPAKTEAPLLPMKLFSTVSVTAAAAGLTANKTPSANMVKRAGREM